MVSLLTPVGTSKSLEDVDTGRSPGGYRFDMGIEFEVGLKVTPKYASVQLVVRCCSSTLSSPLTLPTCMTVRGHHHHGTVLNVVHFLLFHYIPPVFFRWIKHMRYFF